MVVLHAKPPEITVVVTSTALLNLSFDDADSASSWTEVADATSDEGSIAWAEDAGNPGGALSQ